MVNTLSTRSDSGSQRTVARGRGEGDHDEDNDQSKDEEYDESDGEYEESDEEYEEGEEEYEEGDDEYDEELAAGDTYELEMARHPAKLLKGLNELRCGSSLCDVVLRSGDTKLACHRCVLSSASVYFKAMFAQKMKEAVDGEVTINGVDCDSLRALLDFIYTGRITITQSNVQSLTSAANLLQILDVKNACSLFMEKHLDATNSIGIHGFAEAMNCPKLIQVSMQFCHREFCDIIEHEEFLSLSADKLIQLISSDRLNVVKEEIVFSAVVKWLQHKSDTRKHMISNVLSHVRLPLMSPYVLQDGVSLLRNLSGEANSDWMALIEEARLYNLLPDRRCAMQNSRTKPRRKSRFTKVILCVGGKCDRVVLQSVEAFHLLSDSWIALDNLPFAISGHCLVVSGRNVVYLLGGEFSASLSSRQVLKFDPVVGVWQEMSPMFVCRSLHGAAVIDGYIYVVGGWDGSAGLSSVERYDIDANEWEKVQSLPHAIYSASVVAHEGFLYVAGGVVDGKIGGVSSLLRYDPRQQCWHSGLASMLAPRRDSAVAVTNQQIFVFGGSCHNMDRTNSVECYDIVNNKWRVCAPMKERRHGHGAAVIGDCVYMVGGSKHTNSSLSSVECYNISENTWTDCVRMSTARSWISCAALEMYKSFLT